MQDVGFPYILTPRRSPDEAQALHRRIDHREEHEAGATVAALAQRHGVAENAIFRLKAKSRGMAVSEAKRLQELEAENQKLKSRPSSTKRR